MRYLFENQTDQEAYKEFLDTVAPRFLQIKKFCESVPEDSIISLKKRLLEYEQHNLFLSYHYKDAFKFYQIAIAQEWRDEGEFKGAEERKVRAQVEARAVEPAAILEHFDHLIKGLATSLTATQTNVRIEEALLTNRT